MTTPLDLSQPVVNSPRLHLGVGGPATLLDGGWWPHSTDPDAELPALIAAIDHVRTPIRRLVLSADGWTTHPRSLQIGLRTIRIGYFASQPATLLTAICERGDRVDLLVVAPGTATQTAIAAMAMAADATNTTHAQHITAAATAAGSSAADRVADQVWEADEDDPHVIRPRTIQADDHRLPGVAAHGLAVGSSLPTAVPPL